MFAVCDIGATKTRVGVSRSLHVCDVVDTYETPRNFDDGVQQLIDTILTLADGEAIDICTVGIAGSLLPNRSGIYSAHLSDWEGRDLKDPLSIELGCPVYIENDAAMVGLGEAVFGAGRRDDMVAYLTFSTGVGGALIVNQDIAPYVYGFEPGRQIMLFEGGVDKPKAVDAHISGNALEERFNKPPHKISDKKVWDEVTKIAAYTIYNTFLYWSPDVVVVGGGFINHNVITIRSLQSHLADLMFEHDIWQAFAENPPVLKAELDDVGGLYGGLAYIKNKL